MNRIAKRTNKIDRLATWLKNIDPSSLARRPGMQEMARANPASDEYAFIGGVRFVAYKVTENVICVKATSYAQRDHVTFDMIFTKTAQPQLRLQPTPLINANRMQRFNARNNPIEDDEKVGISFQQAATEIVDILGDVPNFMEGPGSRQSKQQFATYTDHAM